MDPAEQICRFCLSEEDLLTDCSLYDGAVQVKLFTIFSFPFDSRASLPSNICTSCYHKIDEYYEFTEEVRQNQQQLIAREALTSQVNIKLESTEAVVLEKPTVVKEPVPIDLQTITIKAEVTSDEVVNEDDETHVVGYDSNRYTVQSQDDMVQFKVEFEDTELQSEGEPSVDRVNKTAAEDRLIKNFFGLVCETCSTQFDSFTLLKQHTRVTHNKKLSFTCCNKQHSRRYQLLEHIALHSNPTPFQCDSCDKTYKRKLDLANHRLIAHSGEEGRPFKCNQCMRSYPKRHMLTSHMTKHVPMECDICHKVVSNSATLKHHKTQVHSDANRHICDVCGKELSSKHAVHRHKLQLHEAVNEATRVACGLCQRWFVNEESMRHHLKTKHDNNKATCDVCSQVCPNRIALRMHKMRVHVEAAHECDICGKKFKRKIPLRDHYAMHTGEKLYTCNLCGLQMSSSSNLYSHRRKKHAKESAESKQKGYANSPTELDKQ
ncbi:zinc finger protein 530-like [Ochlerotatus camptorhynchus]|uniref:zinc finger protein 530-like n=1 Tax=Ochlerotatus camptorhynchus TaxID=644619 RepID=UPI0031CE7F33